jgi:DNA-binding transcriptional regulator YhcF (GntR family)
VILVQPSTKTTKAQRLARKLRRAIATGEYQAGQFLPSERDLAEQYETSRKTIGDALEELATEGMVIRAHGRGTQVTGITASHTEQATVRILHGLHPKTDIIWGEGIDIYRGMQETLDPTDFAVDDYCHINGVNKPELHSKMPDTLCPTVFLEAPPAMRGYIDQLREAGIPFVIANLEYRELPYDCTWTDHADAARRAVEVLHSMGHRRIGYIGTTTPYLFYEDTERGYVEAMRERGLAVDESLMARTSAQDMPLVLAGFQSAQQLLNMADRPTGIVAARDAFAQGAWLAVEQMGLTVGVDVSLVGYDDVSGWGMSRPLTTFREPCYEMGAKAAAMLIDRVVNGPRQAVERVCFDAELVIRQSAGPAPRRK